MNKIFGFFHINKMHTPSPLKKSRFHFFVQIVAQCSETNEKYSFVPGIFPTLEYADP